MTTKNRTTWTLALAFSAGSMLACAAWAGTADFYLRAQAKVITMPDGVTVPIWGFAQDSAFGAHDGVVSVPGPMLTVPPGTTTVRITLENKIPNQPVSIVIPGQTATAMAPVRFVDGESPGNVFTGRARSFTTETLPGNTAPVVYTWTNFRAGSFIYHSGTHPAVQVQMGLYGGLKMDSGPGEAYGGVNYDSEVVVFYSEIDPGMHSAAASGNVGPGKSVTSAINYAPKYFLVNGTPYSNATPPIPVVAGSRTLLRFFNAGLDTHTPTIHGHYMTVYAEGGFPYPFPQERCALLLPALQTKDAVVTIAASGKYALFDRSLCLTSGKSSPGGLLRFLQAP